MKVRAEHWINRSGVWYAPGTIYDDEDTPAVEEPKAEPAPEQHTKRGRKRTPKANEGGSQHGSGEKDSDPPHIDG